MAIWVICGDEGVCYDLIGLHYYADMLDCLISFFILPLTKAHVRYNLMSISLYDTISQVSLVRYYLVIAWCTISIFEPPLL